MSLFSKGRDKGRETKNIEGSKKKRIDDISDDSIGTGSDEAKEARRRVMGGVGCESMIEPVPTYDQAPCETVINGANNQWIVLGRDRPGNRASGYGGAGHTHCGHIDLCVGRASSKNNGLKAAGPSDDDIVGNNFFNDAARIYISSKTDIDKNFGLSRGRQGNKKAHSGIGIKADAVRVIGRAGVKIVTGKAQNVKAGAGGEKLSMGSKDIRPSPKIELIAGNQDGSSRHFSIDKGFFTVNNIQPAVLGDNMVEAVSELVELVNQLQGALVNFAAQQSILNGILAIHTHPVALAYTTPSPELAAAGINNTIKMVTDVHIPLFSQKVNTMFYEMNYLQPFGMQYINSRNVNIT
tara:strand:- start:14356 stop:15411 length:1056 start_codon:yes stop_codon:yes gene_type:complete